MDRRIENFKIDADNMLGALANTDVSVFVYYPQERKIVIPEKVYNIFQCDPVYTNMPASFAAAYVHPDDRAAFIDMYERIHRGEKTASAKFRNIDQSLYVRDTLTTVVWDEAGEAQVVLGLISDETDNFRNKLLITEMQEELWAENAADETAEAMQVIASAISGQYYAIYHIWVESSTYICFNENREGALSSMGEKGLYKPAIDFYVDTYIAPEDQASMREFTDLSAVKEHLRDHRTFSRSYRQIGIGWTRGTFIAGRRNTAGEVTHVIYSVSNINAEVELEEKRKQAAYEAEHDPLTGSANRKGFEKLLAAEKTNAGKIGFAILDIDNFKSLNDNYGHEVGDQVLIAVAKQLTSVFYPNDVVARIGGDEFAILFIDSDASAWNKICTKLQTLHTILANRFLKPHELSITLSVGITFSETGYHHEMYQFADQGLYETKKLGRAGCTLIGPDGSVLKHWQDEHLSLLARNVLEYNNTGVCQIEIPDDPARQRRLVLSDAARLLMGIPRDFAPEEAYVFWSDRIDPSYREALANTERSMIQDGQTECTFLWNHPDHGTLHLRCGGFGKRDKDNTILSGYCHVLKDTHIIERQDPASDEVIGAACSRKMQAEMINKLLLEKTLEQDYLFIASIYVETGEFYLYNYYKMRSVRYMQHFWDIALNNMAESCPEDVQKDLKTIFVKEYILQQLDQHSEFSYAYNGIINQEMQRLEIRFSYADAAHTILLASVRNITDTALLKQYRHDSEHDPLTDLYNRKTMFRRCRELLDAHPDEPYVMLHIDMKHFRLYNTFFGDAAGDKLLCDIAGLFRRMDRDYDFWTYGRIEADVFAVFFPYDQENYRKHVSYAIEALKYYRADFLLEPTIGMYFVDNPHMPIEAMFTRASLVAKTVRPDTPYATAIFSEEMERKLRDDHAIMNEMQSAIDRKQFKVYLQPQYSLRSDQPVGAEALVRWSHPERGLIAPDRFIPIFESNGFITTLDRYVWEHVCQLLYRWKQEGRPLIPISVNVSRISAYSQDTVPFLKELVEKYDIDPRYLELELTESAYAESPEEILIRLEELKSCGFKILMDDFGSGYSSLNTLKDLPIDVLKLDMKFLSTSVNERGSKILVSVIRMSELLNIPVIMEGVETSAQAAYLRSIGCEYVQGYLYARPMPIADFEDMMSHAPLNAEDMNANIERHSPVFNTVLSNTPATQLIDDALTNPFALIGYQNQQITLLRANKAFIRAFSMQSDPRPANLIIREHLTDTDYDRVLRAFEKCSDTKASIAFNMGWINKDEDPHQYFVNAVYKGYIGSEQVFVVAFIDERHTDLFV